jgi:hypothetical protein
VSDPALAARVDGQRRLWVALAGTSYRNGPNALVSEWLPSRGFRPVDEQSFGLLRIVLYQRS